MVLTYTIDRDENIRLYYDGKRISLKDITGRRRAKLKNNNSRKRGKEEIILVPRVDRSLERDIYTTSCGRGNIMYINRCSKRYRGMCNTCDSDSDDKKTSKTPTASNPSVTNSDNLGLGTSTTNKNINKSSKKSNCRTGCYDDDYYVWLSDEPEWVVYTKPNCSYCKKTKSLLSGYNVDYKPLTSTNINSIRRKHSIPKSHTTAPIIIHNDEFIGGYDELILGYDI